MSDLTIIIPFLNEGHEVYSTVENIRNTVDTDVDIIIIDDASDDNYDYKNVAKHFSAFYLRHPERKGVAISRDEGISMSQTDYFLLLDAHMCFYQNNWATRIIEELKFDERSLLSCSSCKLDVENRDQQSELIRFSAYIDFSDFVRLPARWNTSGDLSKEIIQMTPCILGAAYACNKKYWQYLNGLKGLRGYGYDEQLISIKVWLEGGCCKFLKDVIVGHLYRSNFPYMVNTIDSIFNRLYISELLLPGDLKKEIFKSAKEMYPFFDLLMKMLIDVRQDIKLQKEYYNKIFTRDINDFINVNKNIAGYER